MSHELIVIGASGIPIYSIKVDPDSLLRSGFYKAIYDFGKQQDSCLSRIEFLNGRCAYCHYFEDKDLLFFITIDIFNFKEGIMLKIQRLYDQIFLDLDLPKQGEIGPSEELINNVEYILREKFVREQILTKQDNIKEVIQDILLSPEIKAISIHTLDNTPILFAGSDINSIINWLIKWNLAHPPAPYEFEFGNYLDDKTLQGIIMNSGISFKNDKNFILYYIFGESANLGFHMDWLSVKLNKIIG
ncbi:MAG: hypothetical protein ACFFCM_04755 [Promethearchaeota archaeon]